MPVEPPIDDIEGIFETGLGEIYRAFYRLRQTEQYQREYDTMGHLVNMLMQDRDHLRKTYKVNP